MKFYRCKHCGQIIEKVKDTNVPIICCGEAMYELVPGVEDASHEKHVPVYKVENNFVNVNVGSVDHPMIDVHYIEWICIVTNFGIQRKELKPGDEPNVTFSLLEGEKVEEVYAYCNLHGLWKI